MARGLHTQQAAIRLNFALMRFVFCLPPNAARVRLLDLVGKVVEQRRVYHVVPTDHLCHVHVIRRGHFCPD